MRLALQRGFPKTLYFIRGDPAGRIAAVCQIVPPDTADVPQAYRSCQKTVPQTYRKRPANVSQITRIVPYSLSKSSRGRTANVPQTCRFFVQLHPRTYRIFYPFRLAFVLGIALRCCAARLRSDRAAVAAPERGTFPEGQSCPGSDANDNGMRAPANAIGRRRQMPQNA